MTSATDKDDQQEFGTTTTACLSCPPETTPSNRCESTANPEANFERGDSLVENLASAADPWSRQTTKRSSSLVNAASCSLSYGTLTLEDRSARSENDSQIADLASFLSSNGDPAYEEVRRNNLTKWSDRRQNINESPPEFNDFEDLRAESIAEGYVTPAMSSYEPSPCSPDAYESITRSLKEFHETYKCSIDEDEMTAGSSSGGNCSRRDSGAPFGKADQYMVSLPNMDIEDKAMHIDRLIVKSFRHLNNLTKVRFREMLDDDVITAVMERYKDQHRDILFVTPCITKCVMVLQDHVANFLDPIKAKNYDLIFFVISNASQSTDDSNDQRSHWSLLLLHRPQKTFYHYDSMHGSHYNAAFDLMYKVCGYFKIKKGFQPECEQQTNDADCGFYVIHNMLRCIRIAKEELYDEDDARITLEEPLKLHSSVDETKLIVIKTYVASIVEKIKNTTLAEKF
ncbi:uncharacterized protein LOC135844606 [Planococcus citri]|uniref:uncharacterized protein LOC135844606 n=1 Tax=Planococcus citri TaxID=170843 RepID=UPI0031F7BE5D